MNILKLENIERLTYRKSIDEQQTPGSTFETIVRVMKVDKLIKQEGLLMMLCQIGLFRMTELDKIKGVRQLTLGYFRHSIPFPLFKQPVCSIKLFEQSSK